MAAADSLPVLPGYMSRHVLYSPLRNLKKKYVFNYYYVKCVLWKLSRRCKVVCPHVNLYIFMFFYCLVHENIIIIEDLLETHRRPIRDQLETDMPYWRPNRDQHASSETHQRPTCLIGDPFETDMPHWRPMRDWHASLETHRRPTCLIGDRHALSKTDMPHRRPIRNTYISPHLEFKYYSD